MFGALRYLATTPSPKRTFDAAGASKRASAAPR